MLYDIFFSLLFVSMAWLLLKSVINEIFIAISTRPEILENLLVDYIDSRTQQVFCWNLNSDRRAGTKKATHFAPCHKVSYFFIANREIA